jgi:protein-disulfide isomerase
MLVASLFLGPATEAPVRRLAWGAMLVLASSAAGSAIWFIILQKWSIGAFCPYCTTTHITGLLLAALVIWQARRHFEGDSIGYSAKSETQPAGAPRSFGFRIYPLIGLALAALLAVSQAVFAPRAVYHAGETQSNQSALDPHTAPLVGLPDATNVVEVLFDYECPHCQQLHFMLDDVVRRYEGKLAFALCPTPLNTNCNPHIPINVDEFKDSCELARIGLAVWAAKREVFPAFNRWMFSFESGDRWHPRSPEDAKAKAIELVGQAKFNAAQADPWVERYLQTCIQIYGSTIQSGKGAVPKMVFGSRWVVPQPEDVDDLVLILQNSLALPSP